MGDVRLLGDSDDPAILRIQAHTIDDIKSHTIDEIKSHTIDDIKSHTIDEIKKIDNISPVALHIKEVNQIHPIAVEALHVRAIRNVDPVQIEKLNVTNLPPVNLSVRQAPPLDMKVRRVPPLSIGLHQHFDIPSDYLLRASVLGLELARVRIQGQSTMIPRDRHRREVSRSLNRSFPQVAVGGEPGIPSRHIEKTVTCHCPPRTPHHAPVPVRALGARAHGGLSVGQPASVRLGSHAVRGG